MRTFYMNGNEIKRSYNCPAGMAMCPAVDYLNAIPDLSVQYKMRDAISTDILIGPVKGRFKTSMITLEIIKLCRICPHTAKQRELVLERAQRKGK